VTTINDPAAVGHATPSVTAYRTRQPGSTVVKWITSTDHKVIGFLYLITSCVFFGFGGLLALLIRTELARPGLQLLSPEQFNQAFTMHGTIMLLMFATPLFAGFANAIMPLQIGAPDVAFPRLNAFAYWLFLFGSLIAVGTKEELQSSSHPRIRQFLDRVPDRIFETAASYQYLERYLEGGPL